MLAKRPVAASFRLCLPLRLVPFQVRSQRRVGRSFLELRQSRRARLMAPRGGRLSESAWQVADVRARTRSRAPLPKECLFRLSCPKASRTQVESDESRDWLRTNARSYPFAVGNTK